MLPEVAGHGPDLVERRELLHHRGQQVVLRHREPEDVLPRVEVLHTAQRRVELVLQPARSVRDFVHTLIRAVAPERLHLVRVRGELLLELLDLLVQLAHEGVLQSAQVLIARVAGCDDLGWPQPQQPRLAEGLVRHALAELLQALQALDCVHRSCIQLRHLLQRHLLVRSDGVEALRVGWLLLHARQHLLIPHDDGLGDAVAVRDDGIHDGVGEAVGACLQLALDRLAVQLQQPEHGLVLAHQVHLLGRRPVVADVEQLPPPPLIAREGP